MSGTSSAVWIRFSCAVGASLALACIVGGGQAARAGTLATIYTFPHASNGGAPSFNGAPVLSANGRLFGTAGKDAAGANREGDIFVLRPPASGTTAWSHGLLYGFKGGVPNSTDGYGPFDGVTIGPKGVLYGFTAFNGPSNTVGCGLVYKLTPPAAGQKVWTETVLHVFQATDPADGCNPFNAKPLLGADGSIYGTTENGGGDNVFGTLFRLAPPVKGSAVWTETILFRFGPGLLTAAGENPMGSLVADGSGNLFGTANAGGLHGFGTVWEFVPATLAPPSGKISVLYQFQGGSDGGNPVAGLTGPLDTILPGDTEYYGTTSTGGTGTACTGGCGTVFEMFAVKGSTTFTESVIHSFSGGSDGEFPQAGLFFNAGGLWGTTEFGGGAAACVANDGCGTIFNFAHKIGGWTYGVAYRFQGDSDGSLPLTGLAGDAMGHLYGMTSAGGTVKGGSGGVVFEYTP